jgi:hypothetical protein
MGAYSVTGVGRGSAVDPTPKTQELKKRIDLIEENGVGGAISSSTLTISNNGDTLGTTDSVYFFVIGGFTDNIYVYLPAPEDMTGRELTFINTSAETEFMPRINGLIGVGAIEEELPNYFLPSYSVVKFLSDGSIWWITAEIDNS